MVVANRELIANPDVDSMCRAACRWRQAVGSVGQLYEPLPTLLTTTGLALHNKAPDCFEFSFSVFFLSESFVPNQSWQIIRFDLKTASNIVKNMVVSAPCRASPRA
eukprot:COSAG06_NODE_918_length_11551_cov_4.681802_6_plen_106_part_00